MCCALCIVKLIEHPYGGCISVSIQCTLCCQYMFTVFSNALCSMGGAIAVRAAASGVIPSLVGIAVIDVVEGKSKAYQQAHMQHTWCQSCLTVEECLLPYKICVTTWGKYLASHILHRKTKVWSRCDHWSCCYSRMLP